MLSHDDLERERYEARLRVQRDQAIWAKAAVLEKEAGRKEGRVEGRAEARRQALIEQIHLHESLLRVESTAEATLMELGLAALEERAEALRQELARRLSERPA